MNAHAQIAPPKPRRQRKPKTLSAAAPEPAPVQETPAPAEPAMSPRTVASIKASDDALLRSRDSLQTAIDAAQALRDQNYAAFTKIDRMEASEEGYRRALSDLLSAIEGNGGSLIDATATARNRFDALDRVRETRIAEENGDVKQAAEPAKPADPPADPPKLLAASTPVIVREKDSEREFTAVIEIAHDNGTYAIRDEFDLIEDFVTADRIRPRPTPEA